MHPHSRKLQVLLSPEDQSHPSNPDKKPRMSTPYMPHPRKSVNIRFEPDPPSELTIRFPSKHNDNLESHKPRGYLPNYSSNSSENYRNGSLVEDFRELQHQLKNLDLTNKHVTDRIHRVCQNLKNDSGLHSSRGRKSVMIGNEIPPGGMYSGTLQTERFYEAKKKQEPRASIDCGLKQKLVFQNAPHTIVINQQSPVSQDFSHLASTPVKGPTQLYCRQKNNNLLLADETAFRRKSLRVEEQFNLPRKSHYQPQNQYTRPEHQSGTEKKHTKQQQQSKRAKKYEEIAQENGTLRFQVWMLKDLLDKQLKMTDRPEADSLSHPQTQQSQHLLTQSNNKHQNLRFMLYLQNSLSSFFDSHVHRQMQMISRKTMEQLSHIRMLEKTVRELEYQLRQYKKTRDDTKIQQLANQLQNLEQKFQKESVQKVLLKEEEIAQLKDSIKQKDITIERMKKSYEDILDSLHKESLALKKEQERFHENQHQMKARMNEIMNTQLQEAKNFEKATASQLARIRSLSEQVETLSNNEEQHKRTIEELKKELILKESRLAPISIPNLQHLSFDLSLIKADSPRQRAITKELDHKRVQYESRILELEQKIKELQFDKGLDRIIQANNSSAVGLASQLQEAQKANAQLRSQVAQLTSRLGNSRMSNGLSDIPRNPRSELRIKKAQSIQVIQNTSSEDEREYANGAEQVRNLKPVRKEQTVGVDNVNNNNQSYLVSRMMMNYSKDFSLNLSTETSLFSAQNINVEQLLRNNACQLESLRLSQNDQTLLLFKVKEYMEKMKREIDSKERMILKLMKKSKSDRMNEQCLEDETNEATFSDFNENYSLQNLKTISCKRLSLRKIDQESFQMIQKLLSQVEILQSELDTSAEQEATMREEVLRLQNILKSRERSILSPQTTASAEGR